MPLRVAFMGTPALAAAVLEAVLASRHEVVCAVSQPDRRQGRGKRVLAPPVARLAKERGIPLMQPDRVGTRAFREALSEYGPDVALVAAYGHILGPKLLAVPRLGCLNVHASLLPRWRGASPIQAAVLAGDSASGVTIMQMERGLDTGPMLLRRETALTADETAASLHDRLAALGAEAAVAALDQLEAGTLSPVTQDDALATWAPQLARRDGDLDWSLPAEVLSRRVRGLFPWPGTRTTHRRASSEPVFLKVLPPVQVLPGGPGPEGEVVAASAAGVDVRCGDGVVLRIGRLQAPGKKALEAGPFLAGYPLGPGDGLGP